jgi:hypothetical protein
MAWGFLVLGETLATLFLSHRDASTGTGDSL